MEGKLKQVINEYKRLDNVIKACKSSLLDIEHLGYYHAKIVYRDDKRYKSSNNNTMYLYHRRDCPYIVSGGKKQHYIGRTHWEWEIAESMVSRGVEYKKQEKILRDAQTKMNELRYYVGRIDSLLFDVSQAEFK